MPNWLVYLNAALAWVVLFVVLDTVAPRVRRAYRRWRYVRERAQLTADLPPQRLTVDQEAAAMAHSDAADRSTRANAFITRYCADMIRDGVPASEAYREGRRVWDDINLVG